MSFSSDVKGELARLEPNKKCCMLAEIAGFLRVSSSVRLAGGRWGLVAVTENAAIARHYMKLIQDYFRNSVSLTVGVSQKPGASSKRLKRRYYLNIDPEQKSMQILRETGLMLIREGDDYFSDGIYQPIIRSKCCRRAYVRGMFLGCGTVSDPHKSYHLEFVLDKERTAADLRKLICSFVDLSANISNRKGAFIVYMKRAAYISDMMGIMGADNAVLEIENIRINKSLHRDAQRMSNWDNANIDRTISAAEEQLSWIRKIQNAEGPDLRGLPEPLREVALLRLSRPDASLSEIGEALEPPIGKPAVSKRFAKIKAISEKL